MADLLPSTPPLPVLRLLASQGDGHVLQRYSQPRVVEPELSLPRSIPISINAMTANGRDDAQSPMESDEDTFQMGEMSRSWDDIEGARRCAPLHERAVRLARGRREDPPTVSDSLPRTPPRLLAVF